ncbi:uncharacterized protein [Haliotis asinina]|uniref:uncharacterized protein isoform X2 n=2 Tax=Haliotis asinina TaxID=109174 RepID=UPI003531F898
MMSTGSMLEAPQAFIYRENQEKQVVTMASEEEEIVMTPSKKGKATYIKMERNKKVNDSSSPQVAHVAGGQHKGIVINKKQDVAGEDLFGKPQLQLGFMCFLVDQKTGQHYVESRKLKFWYQENTDYYHQVTTAYDFFKELVRPENFPRDYIGFIKKCMKQMQGDKFRMARKVDLEIEKLDEGEAPMTPGEDGFDGFGLMKEDTRPKEEIVREKILTVLESAYPNVLAVEDLVRITASEEVMVTEQLKSLYDKELVKEMENGGIVRQVLDTKTEVKMVKQMPTIASGQQPTIAIITAMYCEKLAIDAMMENKTTYVKYKTEGESNVYTIGYIGEHKVVSTKLPAIGHFRAAQISSGNSTTRLLGSFQNIEHVFVVGVAGGVPHVTDYSKHIRLGDVIISRRNDKGYIYYYCEKIVQDREQQVHYNLKNWAPRDMVLQRIAECIEESLHTNPDYAPWEDYIREGQELLMAQEANFARPAPSSDRLYINVGEGQVIEVQHPEPTDGVIARHDVPKLHFGVFGSGARVVRNDSTKLDFATKYGICAFDTEFDQVLDSICGNVKESFMFVRGIADYRDGSKGKEWAPYSSLAAAAVVKTIIKSLKNRQLDDL